MSEEKKTIRTRRIGSLTFGIVLVVLGILFLTHLFFPFLEYGFILRLWPLVFISLGIEVLIGSRQPEQVFIYDWAAILLMILLIAFACGMAGVDWVVTNYKLFF